MRNSLKIALAAAASSLAMVMAGGAASAADCNSGNCGPDVTQVGDGNSNNANNNTNVNNLRGGDNTANGGNANATATGGQGGQGGQGGAGGNADVDVGVNNQVGVHNQVGVDASSRNANNLTANNGGNTLTGGDVNIGGDTFEASAASAAAAFNTSNGCLVTRTASLQLVEWGFSIPAGEHMNEACMDFQREMWERQNASEVGLYFMEMGSKNGNPLTTLTGIETIAEANERVEAGLDAAANAQGCGYATAIEAALAARRNGGTPGCSGPQ